MGRLERRWASRRVGARSADVDALADTKAERAQLRGEQAAAERRSPSAVRRHADQAPMGSRTAGQVRVGRWSMADGAGALLALVAYGPALAYIKGGPELAKQWFRMKFLNGGTGTGGGAPGYPFPRPGDPGIPDSYTPAPTDPATPGPWQGGADNPPPWMPQPPVGGPADSVLVGVV